MKRRIIITGGAKGLGLEISKIALSRGYEVGIIDNDKTAVKLAKEQNEGIRGCVASVTKEEEVKEALDRLGTPNVLVNNAGIVRFGPLIEQSVEDFISTVNINLIGTYIVSRETATRMQGQNGHIINISSINSITPGPNAGAYPSTKAAIKQMTRQLAIELSVKNIRVNSVAPGFIDAGMSAPIYKDKKVRKTRSEAVPLGRLGTARDVGEAVMFLDSEQGSYVNGHELVVDGGVVHSLLNQLPRD